MLLMLGRSFIDPSVSLKPLGESADEESSIGLENFEYMLASATSVPLDCDIIKASSIFAELKTSDTLFR